MIGRLPPMAPGLTPQRSFEKDPRQWFAHFDTDHDGKLTTDQLLRALVKTNRHLTAAQARQTIDRLELLAGADSVTRGMVTLERFLGIHEILLGASSA